MRNIILAGAAMLASAGVSLAGGSAPVAINSTVPKACSVTNATQTITLNPTSGSNQPGTFTTTCNFSAADFTVNFKSANGGVKNSVENVTKNYKLGYATLEFNADSDLTGAGATVTAAPGGTPGVAAIRNFSIAFPETLTVGGDYADTLTITVAP